MKFKQFSASKYSEDIKNLPLDLLEMELKNMLQNINHPKFHYRRMENKQKIEMLQLEIKRQAEILSQKSREENLQEFGKMLGIED